MRFLVTGRATNRNGSPLRRDGVVAELARLGHTCYTSVPRRGNCDFVVAAQAAINSNTAKVQWASARGVPVITYSAMWREVDGHERGTRPIRNVEQIGRPDTFREQREMVRQQIENRAVSDGVTIADVRRVMEGPRDDIAAEHAMESEYFEETGETCAKAPVEPAKAPRRRIVTRR